ncbi:MAG: hypothetical protein PHE93_00465 [Clostridia bacterium]|nr:hypothetical protein [Clostridia bacterium]
MNGQKSAAKWLAIILLVSISIFSYAMYDSFFVSDGGQVQGEVPNPDDELTPIETPTDPTPIDDTTLPEIEYSILPRDATTIDTTTVQHTGGSSEEILLASHFLGNQTFVIVKTASNSFDFKAENHLALAFFDENSLRSTLVFSEINEQYLDSKLTSGGLVILTSTQEGVCKLRQFSSTLLPKGETILNTNGKTLLDASLYLDNSGLLLFAVTDTQLLCKSVSTVLVATDHCPAYNISNADIVSVQKVNSSFVLALNSSTESSYDIAIVSMSDGNGFELEKTIDEQTAISLNMAVENQTPYFLLTSKSGSSICLQKLSVTFQILYSLLIENTDSALVSQADNGYIAVTENSVYYLCRHLDTFYKQNLYENEIGSQNEFDSVKTLLDFDGKKYTILYSSTTHRASLVKIENFNISLLFSFGAEASSISMFASTSSIRLTFTTALRDGIFAENFGGKDVYYVAIDLTAK